jgi:isocitrate dehydrogenase (NAD+)
MLLEHLGLEAPARRLDAAVSRAYADGRRLTRDQGGTASTEEFADAVIEAL